MIRSRWATLLVLTAINAANYLDRFVAVAVAPLLKKEFGVGDLQIGELSSSFIVVYAVTAPFLGFLGDRVPRRWIIAGSIAVWSLATALGAVCPSFGWLLVARAAVGIGEAGYGSACPSWIADLFPPEGRGRALAVFYLALPVGTALGYSLGGWIGEHYGWRPAFTIIGLPGLLLAILVGLLEEPPRGASEQGAAGPHPTTPRAPGLTEYRELFTNPAYLAISAGMAAMTFVMGGLAAHATTFLVESKGMKLDAAARDFGVTTALAGLVATPIGGVLGDAASRRWRGGHLFVSAVGMLAAAPLVALALGQSDHSWIFRILLLGEIGLFLNQGPLNAALANVTGPRVRAAAYSVNILLIHIFGDIPSPVLIGALAGHTGLGRAMTLTAWLAAVAGLVMLAGMRFMPPAGRPPRPTGDGA